jgi:hypothetical protein
MTIFYSGSGAGFVLARVTFAQLHYRRVISPKKRPALRSGAVRRYVRDLRRSGIGKVTGRV